MQMTYASGHSRSWVKMQRGSALGGIFLARFAVLRYPSQFVITPFDEQGEKMKNPLDSISGTIVSGLILTVVLYFFLKNFILAGV